MITIALLGAGNRGRRYAAEISKLEKAKLTAVCEKNPDLLAGTRTAYGIDEGKTFLSDREFFSAGRLADALIIATQDRDHYGHALAALDLGYNLLLEKPVSPVLKECLEIEAKAAEKKLTVVVCHVLRYAPFYDAVKRVLNAGDIGEPSSVNITEHIGYWHYSHSYVRGNWRNEAKAGPSILAKCCHDLDMLYYLSGKKCLTVSSSGSRKVFSAENAPEDAADYCLAPCPRKKSCPYDVRKIYYGITRYSIPKMAVHARVVTGKSKPGLKDLKEALKTSPYGRCVYKCDNDVIENQIVSLNLEDGVNASLTMTAFSKKCYRRLYISGTKGEIYGDDDRGRFKVNIFGGPSKTVRFKRGSLFGHRGGDSALVGDFVEYLDSGKHAERISSIGQTLESHRIAFAAEDSRKTGKTVILS